MNNTIKHLIHHIEIRDITPIKAAQYMKSIQVLEHLDEDQRT